MSFCIKSTQKLKLCKQTKNFSGRCQNKKNLQNRLCPSKIGQRTSKPKMPNVCSRPTKKQRATIIKLQLRLNQQKKLKTALRRQKNRFELKTTTGLTTGSLKAKPGISQIIQLASLDLHVIQLSQLHSTHQLLVLNLTKRSKGKA